MYQTFDIRGSELEHCALIISGHVFPLGNNPDNNHLLINISKEHIHIREAGWWDGVPKDYWMGGLTEMKITAQGWFPYKGSKLVDILVDAIQSNTTLPCYLFYLGRGFFGPALLQSFHPSMPIHGHHSINIEMMADGMLPMANAMVRP